MPAKELAPEVQPVESPIMSAHGTAEPGAASFQTEGEVPTVEKGGATPATATASQLAYDKPKADSSGIDHGVFQPEEYKHACEAAGKPDKWKEHYRAGHTKAEAWSSNPKHAMKFDLKRGHSASAAVRAWLTGPTIADFRTISVAEQLDELRDDLGDHRFDELFGSTDKKLDTAIPGGQRLQISEAMYTTPFIDQMKAVAQKADDKINKPEAQTPTATAPPGEEKQPRPGKNAAAKHDTQQGQEADVTNQRELGFGRDDLQRA